MASEAGASLDPVNETELAARAAWLHYAGGLTQSAVAARFGIGFAPERWDGLRRALAARGAVDDLLDA